MNPRDELLRDLQIAAQKLLRAAHHILEDRPELAFGELSDARALRDGVQAVVVEQCRQRGFNVGKPK